MLEAFPLGYTASGLHCFEDMHSIILVLVLVDKKEIKWPLKSAQPISNSLDG